MNPIRFAYVGCGFVGQRIHIPNFSSLPDCRFVALAEARRELGQKVAARYGIEKVYASHEEIANDPEIEAVGVSAPYALQGSIAEDLLRAGKQVFMEKPMAVSLQRAQSIVEAERQSGARLMVGYMKRYDPGNVLLKRHLDEWKSSGEAGNFVLARNHGFGGNWVFAQDPNVPFETSSDTPPPAPDECPAWLPDEHKNSYLGYLQQWTHNINLLRFFLGGEAQVKFVDLNEDGMTGAVVFDIGGQRAILESAYTQFHGWEEHTQIYFEGGWLRTGAPPLMQKETSATVEIYRAGNKERAPQLIQEFAPAGWSYREEAKHFLACVRSGEAFGSSAADTLQDVRIFEEIYQQFLKIS
ncbi:MAG TPA: Gfo/Idh/MocA family oxidoreductase [Abditibacteriaceae bacterium]|jgi:predicted dehydrogenase